MIGMSSLLDAICYTELDALSMYWLSRMVSSMVGEIEHPYRHKNAGC